MKRLLLCLLLVSGLIIVSPLDANEERDRALRFPVKAYNNGKFSLAIEGFKEFLQKFPDDSKVPRVRRWLAYSYQKTGRKEKALPLLIDSFKNRPSMETLESLANLAKELGRTDRILSLLNRDILEKYPGSQKYYIDWRIARNEVDQARNTLRRIPEDKLSDEANRFLNQVEMRESLVKIRDQISTGDWSTSYTTQLEGSEVASSSIKNWVENGVNQLWDEEKYNEIQSLTDRIPGKWISPAVRLYKAESLVKSIEESEDGQSTNGSRVGTILDQAASEYQSLIDDSSYIQEARYGLAWITYRRGNYNASLKHLRQLTRTDLEDQSLNGEVYLLKARNHRSLGELDQAKSDYRRVVNNFSDSVKIQEVRLELANTLYELGNIDEAQQIIQEVDSQQLEAQSDYYELRAELADKQGDLSRASDLLKNALDATDVPEKQNRLNYRLAKNLYSQGKVQEAFDNFQTVYNNSPSSDLIGPLALAMVRTSVDLERYEEALRVINERKKLLKNSYPVQYLYFSGVSNFQIGNYRESSQLFSEIVNRHGDSKYVKASRAYKFRARLEFAKLSNRNVQNELKRTIRPLPGRYQRELKWTWANRLYKDGNYELARSLYKQLLNSDVAVRKKAQSAGRLIDIAVEQDRSEQVYTLYEDHRDKLYDHPKGKSAVYKIMTQAYEDEKDQLAENIARSYLENFDVEEKMRDVNFILAEVSRLQGKNPQAIETYREVIELSDQDDRKKRLSNYRLGLLSYEQGSYQRSVEMLEQFTSDPPEYVDVGVVHLILTESYQKLNQPDQSMSSLSKLKTIEDSPLSELEINAREMFLEGLIQLDEGNAESAKETWYEVLFRYSDWENLDQVLYHLQHVLSELNEPDEADKIRKRLKDNFPDSPYLERINK